MKKQKTGTVELGKNDCAIIFREKDQDLEIEMPKGDDKELVSSSTLLATTVFALLKDGSLSKLINDRMELLFSEDV